MIDKIKRPLTDKEKRLLKTSISSAKRKFSAFRKRTAISSFTVFGVLWGLTMLASTDSWKIITTSWLCIGIGISLWIIISERQKVLKRTEAYEDALNRNEADVLHIQSDAMIEFEEVEDEGACYAYQVDDEKILFIVGQDFYSSVRFPNDNFEIIQMHDDAEHLVEMIIDKHGDKLQPLRTVAAEVKKKLRLPDHLEIVKGKLADIEQLLKA
jgi:hypothetical protein